MLHRILVTSITTIAAMAIAVPVPAQEVGAPYVTIHVAPSGAPIAAGDHFAGTETTNTRPISAGAVGPVAVFVADDGFGCRWSTATASGISDWIAVARRGQTAAEGTDQCPGFQTKLTTATAAGADGLIIVNHSDSHEAGTAAGEIPALMISKPDGDKLIAALNPAQPNAVKITLESLDPDTLEPPVPYVPTEITSVTSAVNGTTLSVSGKATFRGEGPVLIAEDGPGDGPVAPEHAARTGVDLLGGYIYQPDPDQPTLVLEWRVTGLPAPGSIPEVVRYGFPARTATTDYQFQAKYSNMASTTLTDDPQGHAEHAQGASFQLRGSCGTHPVIPTVNHCRHIAWLQGEFDRATNAVRVFVPIGSSVAPSIVPGAVLQQNTAAFSGNVVASYQAVVSNTSTQDDAIWEPERTYRVPERTVEMGLVPVGAPAAYTSTAPVAGDGSGFAGGIDVAGISGQRDLVVRACFGTNCATSRTTVTL